MQTKITTLDYVTEHGRMTGVGKGYFDPNATRAEVAAIFMRFCETFQ